jgi:hypothetical protein
LKPKSHEFGKRNKAGQSVLESTLEQIRFDGLT